MEQHERPSLKEINAARGAALDSVVACEEMLHWAKSEDWIEGLLNPGGDPELFSRGMASLRNGFGLTQLEVAMYLDIDQSEMSRWETLTDRRPDSDRNRRWIDALEKAAHLKVPEMEANAVWAKWVVVKLDIMFAYAKSVEAGESPDTEHVPVTKVAVRRGFQKRGWQDSFEMFWDSYELALHRREKVDA